jgi:hypothetical protein
VELTQTLVNTFVVAAVGVILARMVTGVRRETAALRVELKADIAAVTGEISELRVELHEEIRGVRSDLTQVALAVGASPRAQAE